MMVKEKVRRRLYRKEKVDRRKAGGGGKGRKQRKEVGKKVCGSCRERNDGKGKGQKEAG
jgi:hypothetical protein